MPQNYTRFWVTLLALGGLTLSSCASSPPPLTSVQRKDCAAKPDLTGASDLAADQAAMVSFDASSPCIALPGQAASVYHLFRLPAQARNQYVDVVSTAQEGTLFVPKLALLDGQGQVLRGIGHETVRPRGDDLAATIWPGKDEVYLLVESDNTQAGHQTSETIKDETPPSASCGEYGCHAVHTSTDITYTTTYSVNGQVTVTVHSIPK
jgi:hypothetical protein